MKIKLIQRNIISKIEGTFDSKLQNAFKWSFIGQIFTRLINLVSSIVLARLMTPEGYGKYIYLIGTLVFLAQLFSLSLRSTSIRNVSFLYEKDKTKCQKYIYASLFSSFTLGLVGIFILFILSYVFIENIIVKEYTLLIVAIALLAILSEIIYSTTTGILEGLKLFRKVNILTLNIAFSKFVFAWIGFLLYDIEGAIIGWVAASLVGLLFCLFYVKIGLKEKDININNLSISKCIEEFKLFLNFAIPSTIELIVILASTWIIQTLILRHGDLGKKEIAIYNIANQWKALLIYLPAIMINMLQSFFSGYYSEGKMSSIEFLYKKTKKVVIGLSIFLGLFFIIFSDQIISIFGEGYNEASDLLIIMVIPAFFVNLNSLNRHLLLSQGKVWLITLNNIIAAVSMILLFTKLTDYFELATSFAVAVGIGEFLIFLFYLIILRNKI